MFDQQPDLEKLREHPKYNKGWENLRPPQKGEVRNPRGRPKKDLSLAAKAQAHAQDAIDTLVEVMKDKDATPSARVGAASEILDRGFGRAPQSLEVEHKLSLGEEFEAFIRSLRPGHDAKLIDSETVLIDADSQEG